MQPQPILHFWFEELTPKQHFVKDTALDETIRAKFSDTLAAAARCELFAWRATAEGRLAEIIVLDKFSRNVCNARGLKSQLTPPIPSQPLLSHANPETVKNTIQINNLASHGK